MGITAERDSKAAPLRPSSIVDGVYNAIYEQLMALHIAPGARITIDGLARELDVSQTPIREALNRLEREGLVRKAHLIGYSAAPQLTRKQFDDLYSFRLLLEPEAACLAVRNMTAEGLAAMETTAARMRHDGTPPDRSRRYSSFARADAEFHDLVLRIGGNEVIRGALANQNVHLHIFRLMFHARVTREALEEHDRLLAAFREGNGTAAAAAMHDHIERSRDRLLAAFD